MYNKDYNHGWIVRKDSQSNIVRDRKVPERFILQTYDPPKMYTGFAPPKSVPAAGSLEAVLAAAVLLLGATEKEIAEIRSIHAPK